MSSAMENAIINQAALNNATAGAIINPTTHSTIDGLYDEIHTPKAHPPVQTVYVGDHATLERLCRDGGRDRTSADK